MECVAEAYSLMSSYVERMLGAWTSFAG